MGERWETAEEPSGAISTASGTSGMRSPSRDYVQAYYIRPEILGRLERLQDEWNTDNRSRVVCYLLEQALDLVDQGKVKPAMIETADI